MRRRLPTRPLSAGFDNDGVTVFALLFQRDLEVNHAGFTVLSTVLEVRDSLSHRAFADDLRAAVVQEPQTIKSQRLHCHCSFLSVFGVSRITCRDCEPFGATSCGRSSFGGSLCACRRTNTG